MTTHVLQREGGPRNVAARRVHDVGCLASRVAARRIASTIHRATQPTIFGVAVTITGAFTQGTDAFAGAHGNATGAVDVGVIRGDQST